MKMKLVKVKKERQMKRKLNENIIIEDFPLLVR